MLLCQFGNMKNETVLYNTTRFAREVMPKLRHRFSDYEDQWWPKDTLARAGAAGAALHRRGIGSRHVDRARVVSAPGRAQAQVFRGGQGTPVVWLHGPHGVRGHDPVIAELAKRRMR